jgi:diguanylate cyclase (GGDEF)-like protein
MNSRGDSDVSAARYPRRTGDVLARIGGEEFGLLLPNCDLETATEIVDRLRRSVTQQRTCSAGLTAQDPGERAESAVARADQALYQAKAHGRNRVHVTHPSPLSLDLTLT